MVSKESGHSRTEAFADRSDHSFELFSTSSRPMPLQRDGQVRPSADPDSASEPRHESGNSLGNRQVATNRSIGLFRKPTLPFFV